jgi:hypothetical protein
MQIFEKLGLFYIGKTVDPGSGDITQDYLLYDSKDLVTHAVCVGMTGSGKTGLCIALLEEAAIDNIPAIIVDPKGDMTNLALLFPGLKPEDFRPWINELEAEEKGVPPDVYAREQAEQWRRGLAEWGQDESRIHTLLEKTDVSIYTPGSNAGLPLSVLKTLGAPSPQLLDDTELFHQKISTTVSGLLGLLDIQADPLQSREHILLSNILEAAWKSGESLDLPSLIHRIQSPPLQRIGVFDLESFYPSQERHKLAVRLNNLLAAPGFELWLEGQPLEISSLLFTAAGKPRLSILSIAHLSDTEKMFFVTLLLNELLGWVRSQTGTSSLRALFYMDEIFGFFPPVSEPPSKRPLLTLLKQARAFGLGLVLTTQNPVDLEYKGLANMGTWFIGRLQTENDKQRLLDGLAGVGGGLNLGEISTLITGLKKRVFLMHNVHEDRPVLLNTRWTLSYLRGPLTRQQIKKLMEEKKAQPGGGIQEAARPLVQAEPAAPVTVSGLKPQLPPEASELFLPLGTRPSSPGRLVYHPAAAVLGKVAIFDNRLGLSTAEPTGHYSELEEGTVGFLWDSAIPISKRLEEFSQQPEAGVPFLGLPSSALRLLKSAAQDYSDFLVRSYQLSLWKSPLFQAVSEPGETERDFRIRLSQKAREKRDAELDRLRRKYAAKIGAAQRQLVLAQQRLEREQEQYKEQMASTAISIGATILGGIFGRKSSQIGRATTSARTASRAYYERMDINRARQQVDLAQAKLKDLEKQMEEEAARMTISLDPAAETLQQVVLRPKKKDVLIQWSGILWLLYWHLDQGGVEPGFRA